MKKVLCAAALLLGLGALASCNKNNTPEKTIIGKWQPVAAEFSAEGKTVAVEATKIDFAEIGGEISLEFLADGKGKAMTKDESGKSVEADFTYSIQGNKLTISVKVGEGALTVTQSMVYSFELSGDDLALTLDSSDRTFKALAEMLYLEEGVKVDKLVTKYKRQ